MMRDLCERRGRASGHSEYVNEDAFTGEHVLVGENPDCLVVVQRAKNGTGGLVLSDHAIAGERATVLDERIDVRIIERSHDDVHGLSEQCVRVGAQLPIA